MCRCPHGKSAVIQMGIPASLSVPPSRTPLEPLGRTFPDSCFAESWRALVSQVEMPTDGESGLALTVAQEGTDAFVFSHQNCCQAQKKVSPA